MNPRRTLCATLAMIMLVFAGAGILTGCDSANADTDADDNANVPVAGPIIDGQEAFHVIVTSGEPEGVAAALAAARNGMRTLLVESGDALGGLMTLGKLNIIDLNYTATVHTSQYAFDFSQRLIYPETGQQLLTRGIFEEFYNAVGDAFDIQEAKDWFWDTTQYEPNLTVMLNTEIIAPIMDGNTITGIEIRAHGSEATEIVRSLAVIDATVDGDIAAAAGAPYTWGGEDYGAYWTTQGVTLVFELSGVYWSGVAYAIRNDGSPFTGIDAKRAWGFGVEALNYVSVDGNMRFRGPNIARMRNGNVLLNALIIFGVDALDPESLAEGIRRGRAEIDHVVKFVRENFGGFENAEFVSHASRLYVRETRHFIGEYRLTITDVLENRDFWDRIGHGRYPVDIQPTGPDDFGVVVGVPYIYSIPFRSLVPLEIDQLLIVGRSASFDSLAHGSARVIPIGMVSGEAAGTAVAYVVEHGITFREMSRDPDAILWLQNQLISQGAFLVEFESPRKAVMDHWAYPGLVVIRALGLASGGYTNDYALDQYSVSNRMTFEHRANQVMRVIHERTAYRGQLQIPAWEINHNTAEITIEELLLAVAELTSLGDREWISENGVISPMEFADAVEAKDYLIRRGVLDESVAYHFTDFDELAKVGHIISVLGTMYLTLMETQSVH